MAIIVPYRDPGAAGRRRVRGLSSIAAGLGNLANVLEAKRQRKREAEQQAYERQTAEAKDKFNRDAQERQLKVSEGRLKVEQDREARIAEDARLERITQENGIASDPAGTMSLLKIAFGGTIPAEYRDAVATISRNPDEAGRHIQERELWRQVAAAHGKEAQPSAFMEQLIAARNDVFGPTGSTILTMEANKVRSEIDADTNYQTGQPYLSGKKRDDLLAKIRTHFFDPESGVYRGIPEKFQVGLTAEIYDWIMKRYYGTAMVGKNPGIDTMQPLPESNNGARKNF